MYIYVRSPIMWERFPIMCLIGLFAILYMHTGASPLGVDGGCHTPQKIFKNQENSGKLRENSVTSGNICGC